MNSNFMQLFVETVASSYNTRQPWLRLTPSKMRPGWEGTMKRRSQHGDKIRPAGIETIASDCQRGMLHGLYGVSSYKLVPGVDTVNIGKGGTVFNKEIDRIMRAYPEHVVVGADRVPEARGWWDTYGRVQVKTPSGAPYRNIEGGKNFRFSGSFDFATTPDENGEQALIEMKTVWDDEPIPTEPARRAWNQLAFYIVAANKTGGWLLYLPGDLDKLNPADPSTFSYFWMDYETAQDVANEASEALCAALEALESPGTDDAPHGSPEWFYGLLDGLPVCDYAPCCGKAERFHQSATVNPDWSYTITA